jgi:hypothetical protein
MVAKYDASYDGKRELVVVKTVVRNRSVIYSDGAAGWSDMGHVYAESIDVGADILSA